MISGTTVAYTLVVQGLASTPTAAHIHRGLLGAAGPVVVPFPAPFVNGVSSGTTTVTPALAAEILSNPSGFYVNAHTVEFPGGAVRGVLNASTPATTYFPTVVKAGGVNGTSFVSDLRIVNTTATTANVTSSTSRPASSAAGPTATMTVPVTAGSQAVYDDVLGSLFGASGLGSLRLTSDVPVVVSSRVLNDQRPVDGGTNGLLVPASVLTDAPINGTLPLLSNGSPEPDRGEGRVPDEHRLLQSHGEQREGDVQGASERRNGDRHVGQHHDRGLRAGPAGRLRPDHDDRAGRLLLGQLLRHLHDRRAALRLRDGRRQRTGDGIYVTGANPR